MAGRTFDGVLRAIREAPLPPREDPELKGFVSFSPLTTPGASIRAPAIAEGDPRAPAELFMALVAGRVAVKTWFLGSCARSGSPCTDLG